MRINTILLLAASAITTLAQSNTHPDCIEKCIDANPTSSFCDGDETGDAKDKCLCDTYSGSSMIPCMRKCSVSDQSSFAAIVPEACRAALFPGVTVDEAATTGDAAATSAAETGSDSVATTTSGGSASQTSEATAGTTTDGGSAAAGKEVSILLAAAGVLAALLA
ncbi:hypothetical protein B0T11DRAFT_275939 [Plectosphaerella cucumerina]|uniref:Extracellular membrane protein CFEM domain-containing protein n=1 Tax=Plectosphaerella cucumerina TaxID=40658 RepID=A0A8K0X6N4_9PEZI|nr:hypothetical protein B0T11DRAFT_275939 [Plectosphaerella cucumerina]